MKYTCQLPANSLEEHLFLPLTCLCSFILADLGGRFFQMDVNVSECKCNLLLLKSRYSKPRNSKSKIASYNRRHIDWKIWSSFLKYSELSVIPCNNVIFWTFANLIQEIKVTFGWSCFQIDFDLGFILFYMVLSMLDKKFLFGCLKDMHIIWMEIPLSISVPQWQHGSEVQRC